MYIFISGRRSPLQTRKVTALPSILFKEFRPEITKNWQIYAIIVVEKLPRNNI
jgi:hypothetical protein